ncbi:MAG: beta-ketoacyl synthase N-terminal-like domain-containing protein, partial [Thiohalophilus sp.]
MSKRRVVVTGMGMLSPVGNNVKTAWDNILAGKSGIGPIEHFDVSEFAVRFGGSVRGFDVSTIMSSKDARKMDPFIHYGIAAAIEAVEDSGLDVTEANAERIGVAIGSGIGGLGTIEKNYEAYEKGGPRKFSP